MAIPQRRIDEVPEPASPEPEVVPPASPSADAWMLGAVLSLGFAVRAVAFFFTQNVYGDSVVRTELAERWLAAPHLITSFNDGVYQFGPLHTYVLAAFLALWHDRASAGRLASLIVGVLVIWPTWRVGHRLYGRPGAFWASLAVALWGMHIQMSTTAGSEALALCLFAFAVDGLLEGIDEVRFGPLARSALFLNLGCAVRYDLWLYVPLFGLAIALAGKDRIAAVTRAVMFLGLASVFPLLWMEGNEKAMGDPLYPVHFIDQFHKTWTAEGVAWLGATNFRLWGLVFWPGTLLLTCSPLLGLFALLGAGAAWVRKQHRMLVIFAALPTLYFTVRILALTFSPLARFTVTQLWLVLPFTAAGLELCTRRLPRWAAQGLMGLVVLCAVATPAAVAKLSYRVDDGLGNMLKPVSPVTTMPADQLAVAGWLRDHLPPTDGVLLDYDGAYSEIGIAFFSNIPEARLARMRWEEDPQANLPKRIAEVQPKAVVLIRGGKLLGHSGVAREGDVLTAYGVRYRKVQGFAGDRFEVFRAE